MFTFTGSHFTRNGLIREGYIPPDKQYRAFEPEFFTAEPSGDFTCQHSWARGWPAGVYTYIAFDFEKEFLASVKFEMTPLYKICLPLILNGSIRLGYHPGLSLTPIATPAPTPTEAITPIPFHP